MGHLKIGWVLGLSYFLFYVVEGRQEITECTTNIPWVEESQACLNAKPQADVVQGGSPRPC